MTMSTTPRRLSKPEIPDGGVTTPPALRRTWWKEASVYQIYPASFADSNGDGIGDIPGIIGKLDYINSLGVDVVWLSPILKSPQIDMGYDISDYRAIDPQYGTMEDHDALIKGLHDRGLKYVMDLVVNHTSDQHAWFQRSKAAKKGDKYYDWYIWRPAKHDEQGNRLPPNNWESAFSGSAWDWDEARQEYYLHLFAKEQPDLNWENPEVVEAVHDLIRFWLDKGVDGFRMDVINFISKEPGLPDGKVTKPGFLQSGIEHFACGPRLHEFFKGLGSILHEYDAFSVGEMPGVSDPDELIKAVGQDRGELAMAFGFEVVDMDHGPSSKWEPKPFSVSKLKQIINKWQTFMLANQGWNACFMENHDQGRTVSRYASDSPQYRTIAAQMLACYQALLSGTIFVFQGQELAQANVPKEWSVSKYMDIEVVNHWKTVLRDYPDDKQKQQMYLDQYRLIGRQNARTPMQWSAGKHAGFMPEDTPDGVTPWMDIHPDYAEWNAQKITADKDGIFEYWRTLLELRKQEPDIFVYGGFHVLDMEHPSVIAYVRTAPTTGEDDVNGMKNSKSKALNITNWSSDPAGVWWEVPAEAVEVLFNKDDDDGNGKLKTNTIVPELRNYHEPNETKVEAGNNGGKHFIKLRPYEALVAMT